MADKNVETGGTLTKPDHPNVEDVNASNISTRDPQDIFHDAAKAWRKQINHVQGQLVSHTEIVSLQNDCRILEICMNDLTMAHEKLEETLQSPVEKISLFGKFEDMSKENNKVVQQVYEAIRELKIDAEDNHSITSRRSDGSRTSHRSHHSRSSNSSTTSSTRQRRQELEENAAALKAKMRVAREKEEIDEANRLLLVEIKSKLQDVQNEEQRVKERILLANEKFKIREELAETEARIEVCTKYEDEEEIFETIDEIPCDDTHDRVEHFLQFRSVQEEPPVDEQEQYGNPASNQGNDFIAPEENPITNSSTPAQLNPNVAPYHPPPTTNVLQPFEQTQPNLTSFEETWRTFLPVYPKKSLTIIKTHSAIGSDEISSYTTPLSVLDLSRPMA
ncbi:uncharacterized protein LOC114526547 [Dendronephthya gigantea]|uniref:uncharacterized protein LOC114526547 n=1 Tax=Dendronephthya gigantea TaxID=151771 RepID=UPI00106BBB3C|nr:uncharacterized protein LOC114526547 [Dendronephthya gigantea]